MFIILERHVQENLPKIRDIFGCSGMQPLINLFVRIRFICVSFLTCYPEILGRGIVSSKANQNVCPNSEVRGDFSLACQEHLMMFCYFDNFKSFTKYPLTSGFQTSICP